MHATAISPDTDELTEIDARRAEWLAHYPPADVQDAWILDQLVVNTVRLKRCIYHESRLLNHEADRARLCWNDDRRLAAEELASKLSKKPAVIAQKLRKSKQGCELLIDRWEALARILSDRKEWTAPQRSLALDLLGVPPDLRDGLAPFDPPPHADAVPFTLAFIQDELESLNRRLTMVLNQLDASSQSAAAVGLSPEVSPAQAALRRFESACNTRFRWAFNLFMKRRESQPTDPAPPKPNHSPSPPTPTPTPVVPTTPSTPAPRPDSTNPSENRHDRRARMKLQRSPRR